MPGKPVIEIVNIYEERQQVLEFVHLIKQKSVVKSSLDHVQIEATNINICLKTTIFCLQPYNLNLSF